MVSINTANRIPRAGVVDAHSQVDEVRRQGSTTTTAPQDSFQRPTAPVRPATQGQSGLGGILGSLFQGLSGMLARLGATRAPSSRES